MGGNEIKLTYEINKGFLHVDDLENLNAPADMIEK
jgi:hypothetical protein